MKRKLVLFTAICLFTVPVLNAQLSKGSLMTGVTSTFGMSYLYEGAVNTGTNILGFGISTYKYNGEAQYKTTSFNLLPRAGYFIMDNLAVGLDFAFSSFKEKDVDDEDTWSVTMIGVGPFVRYYYPLEKIYPFAEVNLAVGSVIDKDSYEGEETDKEKYGLTMFGGGIGAAVPVGERVTFDGMVGYFNFGVKEKDTEYDWEMSTGTFGLKMGFVVFFNSK
jgi:hypothetical protein